MSSLGNNSVLSDIAALILLSLVMLHMHKLAAHLRQVRMVHATPCMCMRHSQMSHHTPYADSRTCFWAVPQASLTIAWVRQSMSSIGESIYTRICLICLSLMWDS